MRQERVRGSMRTVVIDAAGDDPSSQLRRASGCRNLNIPQHICHCNRSGAATHARAPASAFRRAAAWRRTVTTMNIWLIAACVLALGLVPCGCVCAEALRWIAWRRWKWQA